MSTEERGPNPGHDHDEGKLMEQQGEDQPQPDASEGGSGGEEHADAGGRAHTPVEEGHPDLEGSRSARDLGGPEFAPEDVADAEETTGAAKGDIRTKGQEPHR